MADIPKAYEPGLVEERLYAAWQRAGCFRGEVDLSREPYCIMIPPPNVTGVLTMGHVLNNTIQDILVRRARQRGKAAMWLPGTDHAGIATQSRVERELRREGRTRHDLGREKFLELATEWRDKHGGIIIEQLKRLGASCDWEREVHTLDPAYSHAVLTAFVKLYERGYIYRGKRMVNWCPVSQTALSDEEVIMKPQQGKLYHMRYEVAEEPGTYLEIATTRPETLMGDTAVAVHPGDERYRHLIGKHCWRPFPRGRIPIIGDTYIDRGFGTGVLKVTPAHDPADFEIGQRHGLPVLDVFNADGTLNEHAGGDFAGMDRFEARKAAARRLEELGLLVKAVDYENSVGFSERADVPIEPRLSEQWFLKYPRVDEAKKAVSAGFIRFWPERWTKIYLHWLDNIKDWCISRQLWWGHRIPVWYQKGTDRSDPANWHISVEGPPDPENWEQEEDCLDTWASSWLWPFATLGWPEPDVRQKEELAFWYPTNDLVTGPDIIFFWVARMIMAGLEFTGEAGETLGEEAIAARIPFRNVYFTGIIRDIKGRKMSKSLGNSPDPLDLIRDYGADGLRFGVMSCAPQGQDILFSEERVEQGRNFCNKLWNACRFRQMAGPPMAAEPDKLLEIIRMEHLDADDHAVLARLRETVGQVARDHDHYEFNAATQHLYAFFWNDFCDWYLEVSKARLEDEAARPCILAIQDLCLRQILLLLHPFIPFITDELLHQLGFLGEGEFAQDQDPMDGDQLDRALEAASVLLEPSAVERIEALRELVSKARALKAQYNLAARRDVTLYYTAEEPAAAFIAEQGEKIRRLAGAGNLERRTSVADLPGAVTSLGTVYLDLASSVDIEAERERLGRELAKLEKAIQAGEAKLANPSFVEKAPDKVVEGARSQLAETKARRDEVNRLMQALTG